MPPRLSPLVKREREREIRYNRLEMELWKQQLNCQKSWKHFDSARQILFLLRSLLTFQLWFSRQIIFFLCLLKANRLLVTQQSFSLSTSESWCWKRGGKQDVESVKLFGRPSGWWWGSNSLSSSSTQIIFKIHQIRQPTILWFKIYIISLILQNGTFIGPVHAIPLMMFAGFGVTIRDLPWYLKWGSFISYLKYGLEGLVGALFYNRKQLECNAMYCHYK